MLSVELQERFKKMDPGTIRLAAIIIFVIISFIVIVQHYKVHLELFGSDGPIDFNKILQKELFKLPAVTIDLWSVTHFCTYTILGYLFPDYLLELFSLGIFWEIVEDALSPSHNKLLVDCEATYDLGFKEWFKNLWCKKAANEKNYWYAKWDDLFSNALGLLVGHFIRMKRLPEFPKMNFSEIGKQLNFGKM